MTVTFAIVKESSVKLLRRPFVRRLDMDCFILMNKNTPVLKLEIDEKGNIHKVVEKICPEYLPIGFSKEYLNKSMLNDWWSGRCIPASRDGLQEALASMNLSTPNELIAKNFGLSLSDQYWMKPVNSHLKWKEINFFTNDFSDDVGEALISGEFHGDFMSPNNTSDGWLRKKWTISDGKRVLLKAGSAGYQQEPLNEVLANIICRRLKMENYTKYHVQYTEDYAFSVCENFITEDTELATAKMVMEAQKQRGNISDYQHYVNCCDSLGFYVIPALDDMLVLDFIICNQDRHYNNFGIIRNVHSLEIEKAAPIFDTGTAAFVNAADIRIENKSVNKAKPFRKYHEEQIQLVSDIEKYDFSALKGIEEEYEQLLKASPFMHGSRRDKLVLWIQKRTQSIMNRKLTNKNLYMIQKEAKQVLRKRKTIR